MNTPPFTSRGDSRKSPHLAWTGAACLSLASFPARAGKGNHSNNAVQTKGKRNAERDAITGSSTSRIKKHEGRPRAGHHSLEMVLCLLPPQVRQLGVQQRGFELVEEFLETLRAFRGEAFEPGNGGKPTRQRVSCAGYKK